MVIGIDKFQFVEKIAYIFQPHKKDMKEIEANENLKEVSNWGEIYRYIKNNSI